MSAGMDAIWSSTERADCVTRWRQWHKNGAGGVVNVHLLSIRIVRKESKKSKKERKKERKDSSLQLPARWKSSDKYSCYWWCYWVGKVANSRIANAATIWSRRKWFPNTPRIRIFQSNFFRNSGRKKRRRTPIPSWRAPIPSHWTPTTFRSLSPSWTPMLDILIPTTSITMSKPLQVPSHNIHHPSTVTSANSLAWTYTSIELID